MQSYEVAFFYLFFYYFYHCLVRPFTSYIFQKPDAPLLCCGRDSFVWLFVCFKTAMCEIKQSVTSVIMRLHSVEASMVCSVEWLKLWLLLNRKRRC